MYIILDGDEKEHARDRRAVLAGVLPEVCSALGIFSQIFISQFGWGIHCSRFFSSMRQEWNGI